MVKSVSADYITQESRQVGAEICWAVTYQKSAAVKATIPNDEIMSLPVISNAIGRDFLALSGGDVTLELDNRSRQWDETYANAYNVAKYDGDLRVYAGFRLPDGSSELVELFSGKIVQIDMSGVKPRNAVITARNPMADRITKTRLDAASGSTPFPYFWGTRGYEPLFQLDSASPSLWHLMYKGTLSYFTQAYKRRGALMDFRAVTNLAGSYVASKLAKTVRFVGATAGNENRIHTVVRDPGTHPAYVVRDILVNRVGIPSSHINATSLSRIRTIDATTRIGVKFESDAGKAIERLCHYMYAGAVVEGKKFNLISLSSPVSAGISLTDSDYQGIRVTNDKTRIINQVEIPYFRYPVTRHIKKAKNATSQASYGSMLLSAYYDDFSYTIDDPITPQNLAAVTDRLQRIANTIVRYNAHAKRVFHLAGVYSKGFRIELGDRLQVSSSFFEINQASAVVISKTVDLERKRTDLMLLSWP